ncbi:uncharacterized protein [Epargyreus clarus]|uniref:uncharacterized protein isoform X2 n=1 Tax=Epargyreus clarus TaxID=520877 RepID=UPI003C2F714A
MNDPWDVKSVRQSSQYLSCMKINGVPLLPPVLSKECRKEMQYYKLLAKEVEKRISQLRPFVIESDTESSEDKTDAPELPESEHSYELAAEDIQANFNINIAKVTEVTTDNNHLDSPKLSPDCTEITKISNFTVDSDSSSKNTSKFVIDLSLSINETGKSFKDNFKSPENSTPPVELPERDCEYVPKSTLQRPNSIDLNAKGEIKDSLKDKLNFSFSLNRDNLTDPTPNLSLPHDGPSSLSAKSFTGSLIDIYTESIKESKTKPLIRQRSYTVLKPSPMLIAHLEVQSLNTGVEMTSISMSESLSNLSSSNKKRRSWDLESAKAKWSNMALELKQKNISNHTKPNGVTKEQTVKSAAKKTIQSTPPRAKSVTQERPKRIIPSPKVINKTEPIQKPKKALSPVRNTTTNHNANKTPASTKPTNQKVEAVKKPQLISESDDPATRVRELYEKIQKQQLVQMANLVDKQKREQMLLQQVFEEQNNLLFTQLKTICPKSPNEIKEAWIDNIKEPADRGPVSLSQLINQKTPDQSSYESPVLSTLTDTHNYINQCDNVLKKSRDITGSIKKPQPKRNSVQPKEKAPSPKSHSEGSRTRTHSPTARNTSTSRKLTYETSLSSDRDYDPILTDRTNDTMADLNVTFPSDHSDDCQPCPHNNIVMNNLCSKDVVMVCQNSVSVRTPCSEPNERSVRSSRGTKPHSLNSTCIRQNRQNIFRPPTAQECAAATTIVAYAKGYLVRRLMKTERVQSTVQTIKDALLCALQLHQDREGIRGADVDLHRRLIQQITAACYALHDTFVASSPAERCGMIAADRGRRRSLAARPPPPPRQYKPTDL